MMPYRRLCARSGLVSALRLWLGDLRRASDSVTVDYELCTQRRPTMEASPRSAWRSHLLGLWMPSRIQTSGASHSAASHRHGSGCTAPAAASRTGPAGACRRAHLHGPQELGEAGFATDAAHTLREWRLGQSRLLVCGPIRATPGPTHAIQGGARSGRLVDREHGERV
jgi:hypothetical protein